MSILEEDSEFELVKKYNVDYCHDEYKDNTSISLKNIRQVNLLLEFTEELSDDEINSLLELYVTCDIYKYRETLTLGSNIFMCDFFLNQKTKSIIKIPLFFCNQFCNVDVNTKNIKIPLYDKNINKIKKIAIQYLIGEIDKIVTRILITSNYIHNIPTIMICVCNVPYDIDELYLNYPNRIILKNFIIRNYFGKKYVCVLKSGCDSCILLKNSLYTDNIDDIKIEKFESNVILYKSRDYDCYELSHDSCSLQFEEIKI
jgi:hypothetical protein